MQWLGCLTGWWLGGVEGWTGLEWMLRVKGTRVQGQANRGWAGGLMEMYLYAEYFAREGGLVWLG